MKKQPSQPSIRGGAYVLHLKVKGKATVRVGALGEISLAAGNYVYVGSARKSIESRVSRHRRLADTKTGKLHWHIDYLLTHPKITLIGQDAYAGCRECAVAQILASLKGVSIPVPRFGASDCRAGCGAHLFQVGKTAKRKMSPSAIQKARGRM
ncbi:MAG: GIY-YIG nuclease family protein [Acidobacteria bacterium]|nr:GIY-YIG nuclease family protein [Acidobacteriota bacterium]